MSRRFERVDSSVRRGRMGGLPIHLDLKMQTAVMRVHYAIRESGADDQIGLTDPFAHKKAWTDIAAGFLIVGEMQLDRAVQRNAGLLERKNELDPGFRTIG